MSIDWNFIHQVKVKIERCIQKYMSLDQTMTYLHANHCIDLGVTRTIWEYLQRDNQDFFKEYYKRCELIHQIAKFNELLDQQIDKMQKIIENNLTATAPVVTQLHNPNHPQDQLNHHNQDQVQVLDQRIKSRDYGYPLNSVSSFIDPFAPTQSDASTSGFGYNLDLGNLSERFYYPQEHQSTTFQLQEDFGYDGFNNNNNGLDPTYYWSLKGNNNIRE